MNEIIWAETAEESYIEILKSFLDNGYTDAALDFDEKVEKLLQRLRHFEALCPVSQKIKNMRKCVINSRFSVVYRTSKNTIELMIFIENKSNHDF